VDPNINTPKYVGAHIEFIFTVSDQEALNRCCCVTDGTDAEVGWIQYRKARGSSEDFWGIDTGERLLPFWPPSPPPHWVNPNGANMNDSPGSIDRTPRNTDFRSQLHCRNCSVPGQCSSPSGYKKIGHLMWQTTWTGLHGSSELKGSLSWDGIFVLPHSAIK
jgi:hypothetical protein